MAKRDLIGETFGRLLVIGIGHDVQKLRVECECGTTKDVHRQNLMDGRTQSCGCGHIKHGATTNGKQTPEYLAWRNMLGRVNGWHRKSFKNYGGRGVSVCEEWLAKNGFQKFLAHVGPRPSAKHSLDRYPDPYGNYEPGNVRWATRLEQAANKRAFSSEEHGRAKLTENEVEAIRTDPRSQSKIATEYGISQGHVSHVVNGHYWRAA